MRLFIAINLSEEMKDYLSAAIRELRSASAKGNFTHRENLHLTLVFLGEIGPDRIEDVKKALNRVEAEPFRLSFSGFGKFKRNGGDIHWAGVERCEELHTVQRQLTEEFLKEGFKLEDRAYSPHLTLGREVRLTDPSGDVFGTLADERHEMPVSRISLMKSERIGGKLVYTEIYGRDL